MQNDIAISEHASQEALSRAITKSKKKGIYEIVVPELEVGLEILVRGRYYGTVVKITDELIYIRRVNDAEDLMDCGMMLRENFLQKYILKIFTTEKCDG